MFCEKFSKGKLKNGIFLMQEAQSTISSSLFSILASHLEKVAAPMNFMTQRVFKMGFPNHALILIPH